MEFGLDLLIRSESGENLWGELMLSMCFPVSRCEFLMWLLSFWAVVSYRYEVLSWALHWQVALSSSHWFGLIAVVGGCGDVLFTSTCHWRDLAGHDVTKMKRNSRGKCWHQLPISIIILSLWLQCLPSLVFETLLFPSGHITVWQMAHVAPFIARQHHMTNGFHSSLLGSLWLFF